MDKKIEPGCFRVLEADETRVLFMRHGAHKDNVLKPEAVLKCKATGIALKNSGIEIAVAGSSPSPRAVQTNLHVQDSYGKMLYTHTDTRLSDMALEDADTLAALEVRVKARGITWGDPGIAEVGYDPEEAFMDVMVRRACDGAEAIRKMVRTNRWQTILVTSHGVARIESTIMDLRNDIIHRPERLIAECQIVELIFDADDKLAEENWLEPIAIPTVEVIHP